MAAWWINVKAGEWLRAAGPPPAWGKGCKEGFGAPLENGVGLLKTRVVTARSGLGGMFPTATTAAAADGARCLAPPHLNVVHVVGLDVKAAVNKPANAKRRRMAAARRTPGAVPPPRLGLTADPIQQHGTNQTLQLCIRCSTSSSAHNSPRPAAVPHLPPMSAMSIASQCSSGEALSGQDPVTGTCVQ